MKIYLVTYLWGTREHRYKSVVIAKNKSSAKVLATKHIYEPFDIRVNELGTATLALTERVVM